MSTISAEDQTPNPHAPDQETAPVAGEAPVAPARTPRNQHLKVENPKSEQFTGRATVAEAERIKAALKAQGVTDIVRLTLKTLDYIEADFFQSFKTK